MIEQAMILAAGKGTRMRPLTLTKPKPLIPVAGKPLIEWHIKRLAAAGIRRIVINAGYLSDVLLTELKAMNLSEKFGIEILLSVEQGEPLETAGGIKFALDQGLLHDSPFILVNGDVWTEFEFDQLLSHQLNHRLAHLILVDNPKHHPEGDFGLIKDTVTLKSDGHSALTFAGISVMSPQMVASLEQGQIAPLAPYLKSAINQQLVSGERITDQWMDVGTLDRLAETEAYIQNKYGKN